MNGDSNSARKERFLKFPWIKFGFWAEERCKYIPSYKKRKIQYFMTENEIKEIWFRDKGYLLKKPSLDRINSDGNYEYLNCRFIELNENQSRPQSRFGETNPYKGVYFCNERNKWVAQIWIEKTNKVLGRFLTLNEAINARKQKEKEYVGRF